MSKSFNKRLSVVGDGVSPNPLEVEFEVPAEGTITGYQMDHVSGVLPIFEIRQASGGTLGTQLNRLLEIQTVALEEPELKTPRSYKNQDAKQKNAVYVLVPNVAAFNFILEIHGVT